MLNDRVPLINSKTQTSPTTRLLSRTNSFQPRLILALDVLIVHLTGHVLAPSVTRGSKSQCLFLVRYSLVKRNAMFCKTEKDVSGIALTKNEEDIREIIRGIKAR